MRSVVPHSLRGRLAAASALAVLLGASAFALVTVLVVSHELRGSLDATLRTRAEQVAELAVSAPGVLSTPGALEGPVSGRQIVVEVLDARGRILARSLALGARLLPEGPGATLALRAGRTSFADVSVDGRSYRLFAAPIADAGGPAAGGVVLVASDTTDIAQTSAHLALLIALIGAGVALLAAATAAVLARRGLRPLQRLAAAAGEIERTADSSRRLPEGAMSEELAALTGVLNRMLAALERAQGSERRFLADASHELRTPVTALLGNAEHALRHGADPELLRDLHDDAERLARLVDDLLALERASAPSAGALEVLRLDELVRDAIPGAERVEVDVGEPASVRGDREALRRLLANLVQNAQVHGPAGGLVTVRVASGAEVRLTVCDEGPGPDRDEVPQLFERFARGQGAAGRPGSGLGLSIVAAIAERHAAQVTVEGSCFTVCFPAANSGVEPYTDSHIRLSDT